MMRAISASVGVALLATVLAAQVRDTATGPDHARKMLDIYCVGCHNAKVRTAGIAFDTLTLAAPHENAEVWEKALRKLRGRQMPPPGSRQPDQSEIDAFASWMEARLDDTGRLEPPPRLLRATFPFSG